MSYFAKVENGIVTQVIVAEPEFFNTFVDNTPGQWIETFKDVCGGVHYDPTTGNPSKNQTGALRKNYAGIGYTYDAELDAFIPPKSIASWVLDKKTCLWSAPIPCPNDGKIYKWDEENKQWVKILSSIKQ
jgi:hypothetical protein